ncbi:MAG: class I SAM-dependent methyltransferase [Candidatus Neomarinimicrobiota bacterium]|nr:class I SAM-dependent methyltransferase [Candidatus Neomarinimicrobiota bacterium]
MNKIIDNYNAWANRYDEAPNPTSDLDKIALKQSLSSIDLFKVLELGCGTGKNTEWLITKADSLIGLDFSKNMLDIAKNKIQSDKVTFIETDLNEDWPVKSESFDLAVISLTLEHIKKLDHIFISLFEKLKKGGKCFVSELHPKKQLLGSKARFIDNGEEVVIDAFQHLEKDYIQSAENSGLTLLNKKDWYDDKKDIPRLITLLFEKL